MARTKMVVCFFGSWLALACGDDGSSAAGGAPSEGGSTSSAAPSGGASSAGGADPIGGSAPTNGGAGHGGAPATGGATGAGGQPSGFPGLPTLGTLVVLGDSISDGGGVPPFYYTLLQDKLEAHYGAIEYRNKAESGSKTSALVGQIDDLPSSLPHPVAVVITSGGNDMKAALPLIIAGADASARETMRQNIEDAHNALLTPNRFGNGVEVHVFETTIYDASDGQGDFGANGCNFGQSLPTIPTDAFFSNWNGVITGEILVQGQVPMDMHGYFYGHGYHSTPNWYASDCTHPSSVGHAELADFFYSAISGEAP